MSDVNGTGKSNTQNQQELQNLSEQYRKKREALVEKNEAELSQLREAHENRVREIRKNQDAVVNHISKQNSESLKQQEAQRQQGFNKAKESLTQEQERARTERNKINEALQGEIKGKVENHQSRLKSMSEEQRVTYEREAKASQKRMAELQAQNAKRYEDERAEKQAQLENVKNTYGKETLKAKTEGEKNLGMTREQYKELIDRERMQGQQAVTQTRDQYAEQIKNTHMEGDKTLGKEKISAEQRINMLKEQHKMEIDEKTKLHQNEMKAEDEKFQEFKKTTGMEYRKELVNQKQEFAKTYDKNRELQSKVLEDQKQTLKEEMWKQKAESIKKFGKYADKQQDPFYNLQNFETALQEDENYFYVHTKVPDHEKDNVSIRVKGEKVIVSGKRGFEDRVEKADRIVTSNNYQSFREIIPLDKPVIGKAVQEYYEPGRMTVKIPKNTGRKGFGNV